MMMMMISNFNGTSAPKGSYGANAGVNCPIYESKQRPLTKLENTVMVLRTKNCTYCQGTALCESVRYQAWPEQNVRQERIPRVRP